MILKGNEKNKKVNQCVYPAGYKEVDGTIYKEDQSSNLHVVMKGGYKPYAFVREIDRQGELNVITAIVLSGSEGKTITIKTDAIFDSRKTFINESRLNGLVLNNNIAKLTIEFFTALLEKPETYFPHKQLAAKQCGFAGKDLIFVFPYGVIQKHEGKSKVTPPVVSRTIQGASEPQGDYDIYREKVLASNAPDTVKFSIILALSAMLLDFSDVESGGFHLYGSSGSGKTTNARIAGSVYGRATAPDRNMDGRSYLHQFDTTVNALDPLFPLHNNMLLIGDEIGKLATSDLSQFIYKIGSGVQKMRSNINLELVEEEPSRGFVLTTGEISIESLIANANESNQAKGKAVRLPSIMIKPEYFETDKQSSNDYIEEITKVITKNYGHLSRHFITALFSHVESYDEISTMVEEYYTSIYNGYIKRLEPSTSIYTRFLQRLSFIEAVGHIASDLGVLTWSKDSIHNAMMFIYKCWKSEDANTMTDAEVGVKNIVNCIKRNVHGFLNADNKNIAGKANIIGYQRGDYFYILTERFERLCGTANIDDVLKLLKQKGLLLSDKGKRVKRVELKAVGKRAYYYVLSRDILSEL